MCIWRNLVSIFCYNKVLTYHKLKFNGDIIGLFAISFFKNFFMFNPQPARLFGRDTYSYIRVHRQYKNNRFQKKLIVQKNRIYEYVPPQLSSWPRS